MCRTNDVLSVQIIDLSQSFPYTLNTKYPFTNRDITLIFHQIKLDVELSFGGIDIIWTEELISCCPRHCVRDLHVLTVSALRQMAFLNAHSM